MKAFQSNIRFLLIAITLLFAACGIVKKSPTSGKHILGVETQYGIMKIKLYDATPVHRDNMIKLVEQGYYNGTTFFRVIKNFMMQGGSSVTLNAPAGVALGENDTLKYTIQSEIHNGSSTIKKEHWHRHVKTTPKSDRMVASSILCREKFIYLIV